MTDDIEQIRARHNDAQQHFSRLRMNPKPSRRDAKIWQQDRATLLRLLDEANNKLARTDGYRKRDYIPTLERKLKAAEAERAALKAQADALAEYAQHKDGCQAQGLEDIAGNILLGDCTCGLDEALAKLKECE